MKEEKKDTWLSPRIDRRSFLKVSGTLAAAAATLGTSVFEPKKALALTTAQNPPGGDTPATSPDVHLIFSVCQNCHNRDGMMAEVKDGVLMKQDGNPFHPANKEYDERLSFATPLEEAKKTRGRLCLKGLAGIQVVYDPLRLKGPLKRVGPRGSGQWQSVSWEQALTEIASKINELIPNRTEPIDPNFPELGNKANQLAFSPGRFPDGDNAFGDRIWKDGFGSINNRLDHTSICEVDHHVANDYIFNTLDAKTGKWTRNKNNFQSDALESKFVIIFGENPLEASFALIPMSRKYMEMKRRDGKYVVVDPRFSNAAVQANGGWVPIKPGTDAALALGMARWIIDNKRYDLYFCTFLKITGWKPVPLIWWHWHLASGIKELCKKCKNIDMMRNILRMLIRPRLLLMARRPGLMPHGGRCKYQKISAG